ncbi:uncharacterized protein Z519_07868 [Cladophialophora bantiana CBS 173.52]|uniref:Zn(2)-C6 fungal-type domain-containing protein n=1 Tax=Cladophialophora bantiana (strain ATCC 10958 / CBS 173.52 / CDC B-1940 / NIH 8579) TaxID=1442370 RepID=A0A0D2HF73_CLAB1|nr:uncharacterized protein Z519_07868 [Cladophialophora bantiana CBS 173.52]KIW91898.1 hypothetical protein Z519_07868 [Cladophialophora bantiana CBS 173.52]
MSPRPDEEEPVDVKKSGSKPEEAAAAVVDATPKQAAKKRTKTGCLTCRKRRIKCGEEKPVCKNCIKSKRECAGYSQPVVYKEHNQGQTVAAHEPRDRLSFQDQDVTVALGQRWQPEQDYLGLHHDFGQTNPSPYNQLPFGASYHAMPFAPALLSSHTDAPLTDTEYGWQSAQHPSNQSYYGLAETSGGDVPGFISSDNQAGSSAAFFPLDPRLTDQSATFTLHPPLAQIQTPQSAFPAHNHILASQQPALVQFHQRSAPLSYQYGVSPLPIEEHVARQYSAHSSMHQPAFISSSSRGLSTIHRPTDQPAVDDYEDPDDPFDVEMEDSNLSYQEAANNLTEILSRGGQLDPQAAKLYIPRRTEYRTVATFRPAATQSPLRDERNEHIFCHFVEITSNTISIFERHHFSPIAAPARTLWNFAIPALALSHAALAHAILALGALHLAKLNDSSENLAIKHFTCAVRRVGKLLGLPKRRHEIATLATVLVLGYYEVVSGDHSRWNLHLSGAMRLLQEHDYAGLTRTARRMRNGAKARVTQWTARFALTEENYARVAGIPLALLDDIDWEVDQALISRLTGLRVDYDHQFQPSFSLRSAMPELSEKDVEDFKAKMDLRWWYCKQDVFQSMVSGDRPLMPFEDWIYCPPRGQIGRWDNPYATLDHLLLVMARLANFGGKDRGRKQRAVAAQGGQWKPPKWLFGPQGQPGPPGRKESSAQAGARPSAAPSANEGRVRQSKPGLPGGSGPGPSAGPPMLGMLPPASEPLQLDSAFRSMDANIKDAAFATKRERKESTPPSSLEDDTAKALAEYIEISKAFDVFAEALGPDFEPVKHNGPPVATPFGPALIYKNGAVACVWLCYYVGRISLQRLHPEMPPAAVVAAGVTAHLTREHTQMVGKICAGLYSRQLYGQSGALDPSFAGYIMESTFFLLFAGIQYTDAAQRGWTISKLKDVERRCGWRTSGAIAAACETAWERMGQAGQGPPYERTLASRSEDIRVSRASTKPSPSSGEPSDAAAEQYESEFVSHDRSLIDRSSSSRVHWALGLLSVEEDIQKMALEDG